LYTEKIIELLAQKSLSPRVFSSVKKHIISLGEEKNLVLHGFISNIRSKNLGIEETILLINSHISTKTKLGAVLDNISSFRVLPLGPGELMCLMAFNDVFSGGQKKPDILFHNSTRKLEVKSYQGKFRTTEATSFFTDLGAIIQALVQGGFLHSLTEISSKDLNDALEDFRECLLAPRGYIQWKGETWELDPNSGFNMILFRRRSKKFRKYGQYSAVRNSLRNWLGRGVLSIKLGKIIDPERTEPITDAEVDEYISELKGDKEGIIPIPLDQYYHLCGLSGIIIYDKKQFNNFQLYSLEDLSEFKIRGISQGKVEYIRKKK
jgi:hypothetical protein